MRQNLIVLQEGNKDCGASSLLSIIRYYGGDISLDRLIDMTKTTKDGTNFFNIQKAAKKMGLVGTGYKADDSDFLLKIEGPFIVQFKIDSYFHFVVVYKIRDNVVTIMDPAKGKVQMDMFDFTNNWTGYIMTFEKEGDVVNVSSDRVVNKLIYSFISTNRGIILFILILSIIFTVLSCIGSLYSEVIFDKVIGSSYSNLVIVTVLFSILFIFKAITSLFRNYLIIFLNMKLDISIILSVFAKVILLPYSFFKNKCTSEVLSRISDLSCIKNFISKVIMVVFMDLFLFIGASIIVLCINSKIFFLIMIMVFIYLIVVILFNPIIKRCTLMNQINSSKINKLIIEDISSFETIKGLNIYDSVIFDFDRVYSESVNGVFYSEKISNIIIFFKEIIESICLLLVGFYCAKLIMNNSLSYGDYFSIIFLSNYIISPIKDFLSVINEYHFMRSAIIRGNSLFDVEGEETEMKDLDINGNIVINDLSFSYDNRSNILSNVNLFINDKEKVVIVGSSGSGKSTLLKILYKYLECDRGKVFVNDIDINDFNVMDIRNSFVYVSQNEMLYTKTIRDNILLGRNVSEDEYLKVIRLCSVDDIILNNPLGDKYLIEENGVNLSGGERQRIILARSLLKKSKVIMIDEGFSQIDINLERVILKNIFDYYRDRTFIIVTHRRNNIDLYDRMIRFDDDKVVNLERVKDE